MKPKLLILSDLWGFNNTIWVENYVELLKSDFQITVYDSRKLAGISETNLTEKKLHSQFINGGINTAVATLLRLEKKEVTVLAFSIGGTIAWKAALKNLKITQLFAVSSTRLRYETEKPNCSIQLIFAEKDAFTPNNDWFKKLNLESELIKNGAHEIYKNETLTTRFCNRIKTLNNKQNLL